MNFKGIEPYGITVKVYILKYNAYILIGCIIIITLFVLGNKLLHGTFEGAGKAR
jgi:hypothetical protein